MLERTCDSDLVKVLQEGVSQRYQAIHLQTQVASVAAHRDALSVELSNGRRERFERILVVVGPKPNGATIDPTVPGVTVDEAGFIPVDNLLRTNVNGIYPVAMSSVGRCSRTRPRTEGGSPPR